METTFIVLWQVIIMLLLAAIGCVMFRTGKITLEGSKSIGNILINISLPCVIIKGFLVERTTEKLLGILLSALLSAILLGVSIWVSKIIFKKDSIAQFAGSFSNPGFFGIPLIIASVGEGAVFYVAAFIAFLNLLQWTYGVSLLRGEKVSLNPLAFLKAPFFIAIVIGMFFFLTGVPLPTILNKTVVMLADLNTPLAMFTVGVYLAQLHLKDTLRKGKLYLISLVRLVLIPGIILLAMMLIPAQWNEMKLALLLAIACPVGSNIAVYAQLHNSDYAYAVETVIVSTLLSVITLPLIVQCAAMLWS